MGLDILVQLTKLLFLCGMWEDGVGTGGILYYLLHRMWSLRIMCVPNFLQLLLVTAISGYFSTDILECISNILPSKISTLYPQRKTLPLFYNIWMISPQHIPKWILTLNHNPRPLAKSAHFLPHRSFRTGK